MQASKNLRRTKSKKRLGLWRRQFFFAVVAFVISLYLAKCTDTTQQLKQLQADIPLTKVEMKIGSDSPATYVTFLNREQLDSINRAFQTAQNKDVSKGGAFETWADVNVYKGDKKINLLIQHSVYNGWMIEVGGETLASDYLFTLVRRYAKKVAKP